MRCVDSAKIFLSIFLLLSRHTQWPLATPRVRMVSWSLWWGCRIWCTHCRRECRRWRGKIGTESQQELAGWFVIFLLSFFHRWLWSTYHGNLKLNVVQISMEPCPQWVHLINIRHTVSNICQPVLYSIIKECSILLCSFLFNLINTIYFVYTNHCIYKSF